MHVPVHEPVPDAAVPVVRPALHRRLLANAYLKDRVLLLGANFLGALCGYLVHVVLGHRLGLAAYGAFASLLAIATAFLIPTQVITAIVARYTAMLNMSGQLPQINDLLRRMTAILALVGMAVAVLVSVTSPQVATFLHLGSPTGVIIIGVIYGASFVVPVALGALQGLERFGWYALFVALPFVLRLVLATALVLLGFGVNGAMLGVLLGIVLAFGASFKPLRGLLQGPRASCGSLRPVWSYSIMAAVTLTITVVLGNMDTPLAKHYLSAQAAGEYAALAIIGKIMLVVSNSIVMATFPRFAALNSRGERATRVMFEALASVLVPSLFLELMYVAIPTFLVRILYGQRFEPIAGQLPQYGLAMMLLGAAQVLIYYFLSINEAAFVPTLMACAAIEGVLVTTQHGTLSQLVHALTVANAIIFLGLTALLALHMNRNRLHSKRSRAHS